MYSVGGLRVEGLSQRIGWFEAVGLGFRVRGFTRVTLRVLRLCWFEAFGLGSGFELLGVTLRVLHLQTMTGNFTNNKCPKQSVPESRTVRI